MVDYSRLFADDKQTLLYNPRWNEITGGVTASILLRQINYWWVRSDRRPFYKFMQPCEHDSYRAGDSWVEELGLSYAQITTALRSIGTKITKGVSRKEALKTSLVIYWTDKNRMTWFQLNEPLFAEKIAELYAKKPACPPPSTRSDHDELHGDSRKSNYIENRRKSNYIPSEITSETTSKNIHISTSRADLDSSSGDPQENQQMDLRTDEQEPDKPNPTASSSLPEGLSDDDSEPKTTPCPEKKPVQEKPSGTKGSAPPPGNPEPESARLAHRLHLLAERTTIRQFPLINHNPNPKVSRELGLPGEPEQRRLAVYDLVDDFAKILGEQGCARVVVGACKNAMASNRPIWNFEYLLYKLRDAATTQARGQAEAQAKRELGRRTEIPTLTAERLAEMTSYE